jgi:hypothetical protein
MWWKKPSVVFIIVFSVASLILKITVPYHNFISYDNFGYYMHLPAQFIYKDVALETDWFEKINEQYNNISAFSHTTTTENGNEIMRYYKGMSYVWAPAFFGAHLYAQQSDYPADGFSLPYHKALIFYGWLFSILGFVFARKILLHFFDEKITTITLFIMLAGTSFFYFSTIGSDVPHVYLFTLFLILLWYTLKWHEKQTLKYMVPLALSLGLIIAIRPSSGIISLFPVLWGIYNIRTLKSKINLLLNNKLQVIIGVLLVLIFLIPQLCYYYKYAGVIVLNIYNDPGAAFDFAHPRFGYVLFGFRKGWFIYSTLSIFGFAGLIIVWHKFRDYFWPSVIYFALLIYIIASFNSLTSFGWRAFLQSQATLVIPTGFFVSYIIKQRIAIKGIAAVIILSITVLNIHQTFQLKSGVLDGSRMTREYYFTVLGKNKVTDEEKKLLLADHYGPIVENFTEDPKFNYKELTKFAFEDIIISDSLAPDPFNGTGAYEMGNGVEFSPAFKKPYSEITNEYYCYIRASVKVFANSDISDKFRLVITTLNEKNQHIKYNAVKFNKDNIVFKPDEWNSLEINYITPEIYKGTEDIHTYVWYSGNENVWIDDFIVTSYTLD